MKQVTITAGHSNVDPGAVNQKTGITEASIVTDFRNIVSSYLTKAGVPHKTDGTGSVNQPLTQAVQLIAGSDLAIEFHCNAGPATAQGVEALSQEKDKARAQRLCKAVSDALGVPLRGELGWKSESSGQHSRLAYVSHGGIILELFFVSNDTELAKWTDHKWVVGKAVAEAINDIVNAA